MENGIAESIKYIKNRNKKVATEKKIFTIKKKKKKKKKAKKKQKQTGPSLIKLRKIL